LLLNCRYGLIAAGEKIGPSTAAFFQAVIAARPHPERLSDLPRRPVADQELRQARLSSTASFFNGWRSAPGTMPATSQLDWLISITAISVPSGSTSE
jgi:hypothetical protein